MSIVDLLHQDEFWEDANGVGLRIADMTPRHCANVVLFLIRHAPGIARKDSQAMLTMWMPAAHTLAFGEVERDIAREEETKAALGPVEWLRRTDLVVALEARAGAARSEVAS